MNKFESDRLCDIMRQGFMKPRRQKKVAPPAKPFIACDDCLNWHRPRKHTSNTATRAVNRKAREARLAGR